MRKLLTAQITPTTEGALAQMGSLLRLLQLASPALPIGAFAYSQGLECAVERSWVRDEASAGDWILGVLEGVQANLDLPLLARLHAAFASDDWAAVDRWSAFLCACRESREREAEDRQVGGALARLLAELGVDGAEKLVQQPHPSFALAFALAAARWSLTVRDATSGFAFAWLESQVAAAVRLVPLGQTAGQRILSTGIERIPAAVERALALADSEIGASAPGLAIACALHETQYSRLFRS